jgi:hypothetical protein
VENERQMVRQGRARNFLLRQTETQTKKDTKGGKYENQRDARIYTGNKLNGCASPASSLR